MKPGANDKHLFYSEMAKLLEAGFDIRKAAAVMRDTKLPPAQSYLLKDLERGLDEGQTITAAFANDTESVSGLERSIIGAGERGGKLGPAFHHLADYFAMVAAAKQAMIRGMIYPLVVLHLGVFIATVPMAMMQDDKGGFGKFLTAMLILYTITLALFFIGRATSRSARENAFLDDVLNGIPWVGKARKGIAMSRFCKVYHSCLLAGISMTETTRVASDASQSGRIRKAGDRLVETAKEGNALGPRFVDESAFPKSFARSYATGEEAGTLDTDLGNWANKFQQDSEAEMKTASIMIPKVLYFFILAFIAWKIIGFFTGYYAELDKIGE